MKSRPRLFTRTKTQVPQLLTAAIIIPATIFLLPVKAQQPACVGINASGDDQEWGPTCIPGQRTPGVSATTSKDEYSFAAASASASDTASASGEDQQEQTQPSQPCGLYLAESTVYEGVMGIYSGIDRYAKSEIGNDVDLHVPILDANQNEWSLLHEILWNADIEDDLWLQNYYQIQSFTPGLASLALCAPMKELSNVQSQRGGQIGNSFGVHRNEHPTAGSFSYRDRRPFIASYDIKAGNELFVNCHDSEGVTFTKTNGDEEDFDEEDEEEDEEYEYEVDPFAYGESLEWLQTYGICIDTLEVKESTMPNIGRGAFAKRSFKAGETITTSPVVQFDRSQLHIVEQYERDEFDVINDDEAVDDAEDDDDDDGDNNSSGNKANRRLHYSEHVQGQQLLLNYAFGHKDSNVLLLPYGPGVNYMNHNFAKANVIVDWSESAAEYSDEDALFVTSHELFYRKKRRLFFDYVALRDIDVGEELFLDYGRDWEKAWNEHVSAWKKEHHHVTSYISAADYKDKHAGEPMRTVMEQKDHPYPSNIRTACKFVEQDGQPLVPNYGYKQGAGPPVYWNKGNDGCLRPCNILERDFGKGKFYYTVEVEAMINQLAPEYCEMSYNGRTVLKVPGRAIDLIDVEYTSDQHLPTGFRHEVGIPTDMIPGLWMSKDPNPVGDFVQPEDMKVGQIETIRWKSDGTVVTPNAHIMKLRSSVRESLLKYCDDMGITEKFRDLTYRGNSYPPGQDGYMKFQGQNWLIQRPEGYWKSNMHWISPSDEISQTSYLRALSAAGFDEVLQQIGEHFGFRGLACYHVTFIAVSHCQRGYMHYDVSSTGRKTFNVILPLILANETGPELDLQGLVKNEDDGEWTRLDKEGRYRYAYDIASMMGDDAYHATSAIDYRVNKEMRMAATIYVADIGEENVAAILDDYTQAYPPPDRPDILLGMAGAHWKSDDPAAKLPKYAPLFEDGQ